MPSQYCRSRFKNQANVDIVELHLTYFDSIRDSKIKAEVLDAYPAEIKNAYWNFKNRSGLEWFVLEPGMGLYFKLVDERPFFCNILPAVIDFADYRELEKEKDKQDIKNLLVQKMPIEDGELVFEPEEMEEFHRGSV
nr:MAG TPA: portal protein [Caudoviricetes sp.]